MNTHTRKRPKLLWIALAIFCLFCFVSLGIFLWVNLGFENTIIVSETLEGHSISAAESEATTTDETALTPVSEAPAWLLTSRWVVIAITAVAAIYIIYLEISYRRSLRVR